MMGFHPHVGRDPAAERRAKAQRLIDEMADRLEEVLLSYGGRRPLASEHDRLCEQACYIAGVEDGTV